MVPRVPLSLGGFMCAAFRQRIENHLARGRSALQGCGARKQSFYSCCCPCRSMHSVLQRPNIKQKQTSCRSEIERLTNGAEPREGKTMNHTGEDSSKVIFDTEELLVRVDNDREL